jgi:DNA-binding response OmpR family regulator
MNERILVAEDDRAILEGLSELLKLEGYGVLAAPDGASALELYKKSSPDLVLLDVMMPIMSGYDVCRAIRKHDDLTPVLMLTAKGEEIDKVIGLELGADDYIVKPFGMAELTARVRSALRRGAIGKKTPMGEKAGGGTLLTLADSVVDFENMSVKRACGETFPLTPKETELLKYFASHPGKVISRETLLETVWGIDPDSDITTRSVDTHVARLRQKIEGNPAEPRLLQTVHGAGYRFVIE